MDKRRKRHDGKHGKHHRTKKRTAVMHRGRPSASSGDAFVRSAAPSPSFYPQAHPNCHSVSLGRSIYGDKLQQANRISSRKRSAFKMALNYAPVKHTSRTPADPSSVYSGNPPSTDQFEDNSEEEHEEELERLMMAHLARSTGQYSDNDYTLPEYARPSSPAIHASATNSDPIDITQETEYVLPEACAGPNASSTLNAAFEFIQALQHEQYSLDLKCSRIEAEIKTTRHKVFKLEPSDYWKIEKLRKLLDLSLCLCQELFVAEYAFRDLLVENAADFGWDFGGALGRLQRSCRDLVGGYDDEVARLREED